MKTVSPRPTSIGHRHHDAAEDDVAHDSVGLWYNRDTVNDLWDAMRGRKALSPAGDRSSAKIVLVVVSRDIARLTAGFLGGPARDRIVRVKANRERHRRRNGTDSIGAGGAAGTLAGDVETYLPLLADRPALQRDRRLHLSW